MKRFIIAGATVLFLASVELMAAEEETLILIDVQENQEQIAQLEQNCQFLTFSKVDIDCQTEVIKISNSQKVSETLVQEPVQFSMYHHVLRPPPYTTHGHLSVTNRSNTRREPPSPSRHLISWRGNERIKIS